MELQKRQSTFSANNVDRLFLKDEEPKRFNQLKQFSIKPKHYKLKSDFPSHSLKQSDSMNTNFNKSQSNISKVERDNQH